MAGICLSRDSRARLWLTLVLVVTQACGSVSKEDPAEFVPTAVPAHNCWAAVAGDNVPGDWQLRDVSDAFPMLLRERGFIAHFFSEDQGFLQSHQDSARCDYQQTNCAVFFNFIDDGFQPLPLPEGLASIPTADVVNLRACVVPEKRGGVGMLLATTLNPAAARLFSIDFSMATPGWTEEATYFEANGEDRLNINDIACPDRDHLVAVGGSSADGYTTVRAIRFDRNVGWQQLAVPVADPPVVWGMSAALRADTAGWIGGVQWDRDPMTETNVSSWPVLYRLEEGELNAEKSVLWGQGIWDIDRWNNGGALLMAGTRVGPELAVAVAGETRPLLSYEGGAWQVVEHPDPSGGHEYTNVTSCADEVFLFSSQMAFCDTVVFSRSAEQSWHPIAAGDGTGATPLCAVQNVFPRDPDHAWLLATRPASDPTPGPYQIWELSRARNTP